MSGPKVFIVDDNPLNVELAEFLLTQDGFMVAAASNGSQAMAGLPAFAPDLVLMDIHLPGMDAMEITRRLKDDPANRHILIVAFTAYAMKGDERRMLASGFDGYIAKPIDAGTFAERVRSLLAGAPQ